MGFRKIYLLRTLIPHLFEKKSTSILTCNIIHRRFDKIMNPARIAMSAPTIPPIIPPIFLAGDNSEPEPAVECELVPDAVVVLDAGVALEDVGVFVVSRTITGID